MSPSTSSTGTREWIGTLFDTIYRAYNEQDADATRNCYAPDVSITVNGEQGPADRDAFLEALTEQWRGFPDVTATETDRLILPDRVITEMRIDGHNTAPFLGRPATGKAWQVSLIWVCVVDAGQVQQLRVYVDNSALQRAVSTTL